MTGKQNLELLNSIAMVFVNIILCLFLIPKYGSLGAAVATAFSMSAINLIRLVEIYLLYGIHPYSRSYAKPLVPGILAVGLLLALRPFAIHYSTKLVVNTSVVLITFAAALIIFGFDEEEKIFLNMFKEKFAKLRG